MLRNIISLFLVFSFISFTAPTVLANETMPPDTVMADPVVTNPGMGGGVSQEVHDKNAKELEEAISEISSTSYEGSGDVGSVCLDDSDFESSSTAKRFKREAASCSSGGSALGFDLSFSSTVEGIKSFGKSIADTAADLIKNANLGVCDDSTLDGIEDVISQLKMLEKFLNMNSDFKILFNPIKAKVPFPFNSLNVNEVMSKRENLISKIDKMRMDLMMDGKTFDEIEAILDAKGANTAMLKADQMLEMAHSIQATVMTAIMTLESAKLMIKYICEMPDPGDTTIAPEPVGSPSAPTTTDGAPGPVGSSGSPTTAGGDNNNGFSSDDGSSVSENEVNETLVEVMTQLSLENDKISKRKTKRYMKESKYAQKMLRREGETVSSSVNDYSLYDVNNDNLVNKKDRKSVMKAIKEHVNN